MATQLNVIARMLGVPPWALVLILVWALVWKGVALWISARKNSKPWFIALLVINTMAILEILYIFLFSKLNITKETEQQEKPKRKRHRR